MSAADRLRQARARIATPETWCKVTQARRLADVGGIFEECEPTDPRARKWDIFGALLADGTDGYLECIGLLELALPAGFDRIDVFNDAAAHCDVVAFLDSTILLALAPEAA